MDEVKIWSVDGDSNVEPLAKKGQTDTEELLEETLVKNPDLLIPGLRLVGRQTPTGGGPLDLLGVDEDGRLVVFELKRGTLSRDAVAQIIDYASYLDGMALDELTEYISEKSGNLGIEKIQDFLDWYNFDELESLKPLRLFLVGLGADERTERMVTFLASNSSMDISLITFHGFAYEGKTLLAKQVRVEGSDSPDRSLSSLGRYNRSVRSLENRARELGSYDLLAAARNMFLVTWQRKVRQSASTTRLNFFVLERSEAGSRSTPIYLSIELNSGDGGIWVCFYPRAIELCRDMFDQLNEEDVRFSTRENPQVLPTTGQVDWQVLIPLRSISEWETHKEKLTSLTRAVYEAWESSRQEEASS